MKTLSLKLPEALAAKLAALAKKRRATKSALVRDALEAFLARDGKASAGSFLDLAGDIVGCAEGPGDLSYNKAYLRDYGRR